MRFDAYVIVNIVPFFLILQLLSTFTIFTTRANQNSEQFDYTKQYQKKILCDKTQETDSAQIVRLTFFYKCII